MAVRLHPSFPTRLDVARRLAFWDKVAAADESRRAKQREAASKAREKARRRRDAAAAAELELERSVNPFTAPPTPSDEPPGTKKRRAVTAVEAFCLARAAPERVAAAAAGARALVNDQVAALAESHHPGEPARRSAADKRRFEEYGRRNDLANAASADA